MRRLVFFAVQSGVTNWLWNNRSDLAKRAKVLLKGGKGEPGPDAARPIGDRFMPPVSTPGLNLFDAAKAEEAPDGTLSVSTHERASNPHVSVVIETTQIDVNDGGTESGKAAETGLKHDSDQYSG